jgi:hypothetical protein
LPNPFRLTAPKLTENDIESACVDLLKWQQYRPLRLQSGRFKTFDNRWISIGEPGLPDYVVPAFFVEVKRPHGKLSPEQAFKIQQFEEDGIPTAVVHSVEALAEWLAEREAAIRNLREFFKNLGGAEVRSAPR